MSNRVLKISAVCVVVWVSVAHGQSSELIEAIRVHQPQVASRALAEFEACAKERCARLDQLSLLTGALLVSESATEAAVKQLLSRRPPKGLEPFFFWYLGEAQAWSHAPKAALQSFARARKSAPKWLERRVDLRIAELELELGHAAKARTTFETYAAAEASPEVLFDRALARLATKDTARARADLKTLVLKYPNHPHGKAALRRLEADGPLPLTNEERLTRAQSLLNQADAAQALLVLETVDAKASEQKVALLKGQALLARQADVEALAALDLAAHGPMPALAAEATMIIARRLMRLGRNDEARIAFQSLDDSWPKDPNADEAGYLASWLAMNSGDDETAQRDFAAFEARHPLSKKRDEARWFRAFALLRLGRSNEARTLLRGLIVDFPKSALVPQAAYWSTRAAQLSPATSAPDAGQTIDFTREYQDIVLAFSGTFYARLAIERLRELHVDVVEPFNTRPTELKPQVPSSLALAQALTKTGLLRDAWEEIQTAVSQVSDASSALTYGHALQSMGEFGAAHTLAAKYLWGAVYTQHAPEAVGLMYPQAWKESVEEWAEKRKVDPYFAWAIMRRESAFRPEVTSFADARGLMQLIPPTARQIAADTQSEVPSPDELYAPDTNVRLATWYLAALFSRLDHPSLVAAAYNGGPSSVVKWANQRGGEPLDQWVEEIPFKETRAYVKQVVADYFIYQQLYGAETGRLSLVVPAPKQRGVDY